MLAVGSIYFIQEMPAGAIKIGWTTGSIFERLHGVQTGNPREVTLIGQIADVTQTQELLWHHRFHDCWCSGEWFNPSPELLAAIKNEALPVDTSKRFRRTKRSRSEWALALLHWMDERDLSWIDLERMLKPDRVKGSALMSGRIAPSPEQAKILHRKSKGAVNASLLVQPMQGVA